MAMSAPRFYIPQLATAATGFLDGAEARHAASVLRLALHDRLCLFDGLGHEALARITAIGRNAVEYEVFERTDTDRELPQPLTLAVALPKGDRQKTLVDAATELGVSHFVPLRTRRGVAQPTDNALERLRRGVVEASKQCGRNRLMEIGEPVELADLAASDSNLTVSQANASAKPLRFVAHPYDEAGKRCSLAEALYEYSSCPSNSSGTGICPVTIVIGPEGGLTAEEAQLLAASHWRIVDLGRTILRVEIAAISAVSQIASWLHYRVAQRP